MASSLLEAESSERESVLQAAEVREPEMHGNAGCQKPSSFSRSAFLSLNFF